MAGRPPTTGLYAWLLMLICAAQTAWYADATRWTKRRVGYIDGDLIIGALFPVHKEPTLKSAYTRECGAIWEQYGMHRIEIFFQTLDKINNDPVILPGIDLGCDIRDSCWYAPVALEQSIDFIKNSISSMEQTNRTVARNECRSDDFDLATDKPIAALIGPGSSSVTIQVQNLLSLFNIPEIGYSATSRDLSNKNRYNYFSRVVPSDELQVRALVDIIARYNWTYISAVYTDGNYGSSGYERFKFHAEKKGLCIATESRVGNTAEPEAYDEVVRRLMNNKRAKVVLCFCEGTTVHNLFNATKRLGVPNEFMVIGSDGWNVRPDVVDQLHKEASGGISIKLYSPPIPEFDNYYLAKKPLHPSKITRNPWFNEFWQQKFECYLPDLPKNEQNHQFNKSCTGKEDLHEKQYIPDAKLGFVVNAVYTIAYALHNMHQTLCKGAPGLCPAMVPLNGTILRDFLLNVSFLSYSNDRVMFDANGDPPGRYDIMNYQPNISENGNISYSYVLVGQWASGNLTMFDDHIYWPGLGRNPPKKIQSVCSHPCPKGSIKQIQDSSKSCCWICQQCKPNEYVLDDHSCKPCQKGWLPDKDLKACFQIRIEHIKWDDTEAVIAIGMAIIGMMITGCIIFIFIRHNNTPVVKASTRELSHIILIGIFMSYAATFSLVAKPTLITCYLNRIMPGISFALIYGALVTKTNRIARILAGSKKKIMTRKPRFMSASAQVVITCILIGIECSIITIMLILEPADNKLEYPSKERVKLTCNATKVGIIVPLGFDIFLIAMCTFYAIKTRNLPENFNEAKFIGFSMYTTCVIWTAFVPIYFGSDNKVVTMCLAVSLSASVALVLLFFPKVYIILCKPEKNNRSAFITSKDVRCHIGSQISGGRSYNNSSDSVDRLGLLDSETIEVQNWSSDTEVDVESDRSVIKSSGQKKKSNKKLNVFPWKTSKLKSNQKQVHIKAALGPDDQIWNDKPFEQAALQIYRQKNFFTKWKNKSLMRNVTSPESFSKPFQNRTLSPSNRTRQNCHVQGSDPQYHISAQQENIPLRDTRNMNSILHRMRNAGNDESETSLAKDDSGQGRFGNRHPSNSSVTMQDFASQTDDELLTHLLPSLRRRILNSDSSGSTRSQDSSIKSMRTQESNGRGRQRKSSRSSCASKSSYHSNTGMADYSFPVSSARSTPKHLDHQHPVWCDNVDRVLMVGDLKFDQHNRGFSPNMLGVGDKSPLLASAEHSPLLSADERFAYDSTSEETLSEMEPEEHLDEIDELLSGAGSQADSFESTQLDILNPDGGFPEFPDYGPANHLRRSHYQDNKNTAMNPEDTATTDVDHVINYLDDEEEDEWGRTMDRFRTNKRFRESECRHDSHYSRNDPTRFTLPNNTEQEHYYVNRMDQSLNGVRFVPNHIRSNTPRRHPLSIPQIYVDCVSPSLRETDHVPPLRAGRYDDRRHSGESSCSDRTLSSISLEDVVGMRLLDDEADSVAKFQEYLKSRGLKLDMNSVQSSDV